MRWPFFEFLKAKPVIHRVEKAAKPKNGVKGYLDIGEVIYDAAQTQTLFPYLTLKIRQ